MNKRNLKNSKPVIKFRQELFWDVDPKMIDPKNNSRYVIERILDFGNTEELEWMNSYYSENLIKQVVDSSRVLLNKSRSLWSLVYR